MHGTRRREDVSVHYHCCVFQFVVLHICKNIHVLYIFGKTETNARNSQWHKGTTKFKICTMRTRPSQTKISCVCGAFIRIDPRCLCWAFRLFYFGVRSGCLSWSLALARTNPRTPYLLLLHYFCVWFSCFFFMFLSVDMSLLILISTFSFIPKTNASEILFIAIVFVIAHDRHSYHNFIALAFYLQITITDRDIVIDAWNVANVHRTAHRFFFTIERLMCITFGREKREKNRSLFIFLLHLKALICF